MAMDPRDFLNVARKLACGGNAAERRTAVGRSYYSVFNVAAEHLRALGFRISKGAAAHGEVQKCLSNSGDSALADIASDLSDLHSSRDRADYQLDKADIEKPGTVQTIVTSAEAIIQSLDVTFTGPGRPQLQATIRKWRNDNGYP